MALEVLDSIPAGFQPHYPPRMAYNDLSVYKAYFHTGESVPFPKKSCQTYGRLLIALHGNKTDFQPLFGAGGVHAPREYHASI